MTSTILFLHSADAGNNNPQAKNVQNILAHWPELGPGAEVLLFDEAPKTLVEHPNVKLIRIRGDRFWPIRAVLQMQHRYAGVFAPGLHMLSDWLGTMLRRATGRSVPIVTTIEGLIGTAPDSRVEAERYSRAAGHETFCQPVASNVLSLRRRMHYEAQHIIAISPFLASMAELDWPGKVSVLPLGVDGTMFHSECRGSTSHRPRIMSVAGVRSHKRPELFLDLAQQYPQAEFIWYGDGDLRAHLVAEIRQRGISNLRFPGSLEPPLLAREYRRADIFVLPSRNEGVPKVTQEAAACGLAQVIFGNFEAPTVIDGNNGFVVWSDSAMAERIGVLIEDAELRHRMGAQGAAMAQNWSWTRIAPLWRDRILNAVAGGSLATNGNGEKTSELVGHNK